MKKTTTLSKRTIVQRHIHNRIVVQFILFIIVILGLSSVILYDILQEQMNVLWVVGALAVGVLVGLAVGRIFALRWHEDTQKVILNIDKLGILLIIAYIGFRYFSEQFLSHFLHGQELTVITFSVLGGIMVGRVFGMLRGIIAILKNQNIL